METIKIKSEGMVTVPMGQGTVTIDSGRYERFLELYDLVYEMAQEIAFRLPFPTEREKRFLSDFIKIYPKD